MELSIIISMYNAELYIARCLDSLIHQNIAPEKYEILVMNDGSTDSSKSIVEEYSNTHSNVILFSQKNAGNTAARNALLKKAKGRYVCFVDSDDYVAYTSLGTILHIGIQNDLDIVGYDMLLTKNTDETDVGSTIDSDTYTASIHSGVQFMSDHKNMRVEACWYFVKREFLERHEIVYNETRFHMDVLFTYQTFLNAERVAHVPLSVYRYFQSENSIMRTSNQSHNLKRIKNTMILVVKLSELLNTLERKNFNSRVIDMISFKRDSFLFFLLVKIFKTARVISLKEFRNKIKTLKQVNAYPFHNFIGEHHNAMKFKVLNFIFNHETVLFPAFILFKFVMLFRK